MPTKGDDPGATERPEPCWCGETNPHYDDALGEDDCGGTGEIACYCGGDLCVCHNHGSVECPGCDFCVYDEDVHDEDEDEDGLDDDSDLDPHPRIPVVEDDDADR